MDTLFLTPLGFFYVLLFNKKYITFAGDQSKNIPTMFGNNWLREEDAVIERFKMFLGSWFDLIYCV